MSGRRVVRFRKLNVDNISLYGLPSTIYQQEAIQRGEILPDGTYRDPDGLNRAPLQREIIEGNFLLTGTAAANATTIQSWKDNTIGVVDQLDFDSGESTYARCIRIVTRDRTPPGTSATHWVDVTMTFIDLGTDFSLTGGF